MGRLVYTAITSLDGYVNDTTGGFEWAAPDPQVHQHVNDAERAATTYLYGRRLYDVMRYWADPLDDDSVTAVERDYAAIWQSANKVVYSTTLVDVTTPRTHLRRSFDVGEVRALVDAAPADVSVGGSGLAAQALRSDLVDELRVYLHPVVVGAGTSWLPPDLRLRLDLLDELRFDSGVAYLRYRVRHHG